MTSPRLLRHPVTLILFFIAVSVSSASAQVELRVTAATSHIVDLRWYSVDLSGLDPGSDAVPPHRWALPTWILERKAWPSCSPCQAEWTPVKTTKAMTMHDTDIDPNRSYSYRVRAADTADYSNEVRVGAPPNFWQLVVAAGSYPAETFGRNISMVLDGNDDPMIAYTQDDTPIGQRNSGKLFFVAWNRATWSWSGPGVLDVLGDQSNNLGEVEVALARDEKTGLLGLAYQKDYYTIGLLLSWDEGKTWHRELTYTKDQEVSNPSLALDGGRIYLAHHERFANPTYPSNDGIHVFQGTSGALSSMYAPLYHSDYAAKRIPPSVAVDVNGKPAVAYWVHDNRHDPQDVLLYWELPSHYLNPELILARTGMQARNDWFAMSMGFRGTEARLAVVAPGGMGSDPNNELWYFSSTAWASPTAVPKDAADWYYPTSLAVSPPSAVDSMVIATSVNLITGTGRCLYPKVSEWSFGSIWMTCTINGVWPSPFEANYTARYPSVKIRHDGELYLAFQFLPEQGSVNQPGIVVFRKP